MGSLKQLKKYGQKVKVNYTHVKALRCWLEQIINPNTPIIVH